MLDLISVDDHLLEPATLWADRLPAAYREIGPRLVQTDGGPQWLVEHEVYPLPKRNEFVSGMGAEAMGYRVSHSMRYEEMVPAFYDPAVRARQLGEEGIVGSVCFPTMPKFAGTAFLRTEDERLASLCIQVWNDFLFEEWCAAAPDFYIPMTICQLWDPALAADEVRRNAARGGRALSLCENGVPLGLPSFHDDYWNPLWAALQETETAVCMHIGTSGGVPRPSPETSSTASIVLAELNAMSAMIDLLFSSVPSRYPDLQFVMSESGLGWVPAMLERADREWGIHRKYDDSLPKVLPSELFRRSFSGCFVGDPVTVGLRDLIGVERMMWECDYPHAESPLPGIQAKLEVIFEGVDAKEVDLITNGNARRVFRWS